jgi:hypothetical protein
VTVAPSLDAATPILVAWKITLPGAEDQTLTFVPR